MNADPPMKQLEHSIEVEAPVRGVGPPCTKGEAT